MYAPSFEKYLYAQVLYTHGHLHYMYGVGLRTVAVAYGLRVLRYGYRTRTAGSRSPSCTVRLRPNGDECMDVELLGRNGNMRHRDENENTHVILSARHLDKNDELKQSALHATAVAAVPCADPYHEPRKVDPYGTATVPPVAVGYRCTYGRVPLRFVTRYGSEIVYTYTKTIFRRMDSHKKEGLEKWMYSKGGDIIVKWPAQLYNQPTVHTHTHPASDSYVIGTNGNGAEYSSKYAEGVHPHT
ncbi:hypothetical protein CPC08DRAFT_729716 [Agrocybe pediades]|nr:hypothetical protein CPC08DRAFT_729716 [Agrocybe pediades]